MEWINVSSSAIRQIGYDKSTQMLGIVFDGGNSGQYSGVPIDVYNEFIKAPSIGKYFNQFIKDKYSFN